MNDERTTRRIIAAESTINAYGELPDPRLMFTSLVAEPEQPLIERTLRAFEAHAQGEEDSIRVYEKMAQASDPVMALLMGLVLEDEERHHTLLTRMATRLRDDLQWTHSEDSLPTAHEHASVPVTAAEAKALADEERQGVDLMRHQAKEVGTLHDGLLALLLEMMALDSEKHEKVLRYISRRLQTPG